MNRTVPALGAYAFWRYDRFPYLLGGKITAHPATDEWHRGDAVYIGSYQSYFRPLFVLDAESGPLAMAEIKRLEQEARDEERALQKRLGQARVASPLHRLDPKA